MRPEHGCSGNEECVPPSSSGSEKRFNEAGALRLRKTAYGYLLAGDSPSGHIASAAVRNVDNDMNFSCQS